MARRPITLADFVKQPKANSNRKNTRKSQDLLDSPTESQSPQPATLCHTNPIRHALKTQPLASPGIEPLHKLTTYGNTCAIIRITYRAEDGSLSDFRSLALPSDTVPGKTGPKIWLEKKEQRILELTGMLEADDYTTKSPATCQPAHVALDKYRKYKQLYGERKYARGYQPLPASTTSKTPTGFLDLPAEIRNPLYREWLVFEEPFELLPKSSGQSRGTTWHAHLVAHKNYSRKTIRARKLLRLNKQINKEGSEIFYGENHFRFTGSLGSTFLRGFMATRGMLNASCLRILTVHVPWSGTTLDTSDAYTFREAKTVQASIERSGSGTWGLDKFRKPSLAWNELVEILAQAGNLAELNLVLSYRFNVTNAFDLGLDPNKFRNPPKVKIIHLDTDPDTRHSWLSESFSSPQPLSKKVATNRQRDPSKRTFKVIQEYESAKAYAKAHGWGYVKMTIDLDGNYLKKIGTEDESDSEDD